MTVGSVIGNLRGGFAYEALGITWMLGTSVAVALAGTGLIIPDSQTSTGSTPT